MTDEQIKTWFARFYIEGQVRCGACHRWANSWESVEHRTDIGDGPCPVLVIRRLRERVEELEKLTGAERQGSCAAERPMIDLDAMEARCKAATEGPWRVGLGWAEQAPSFAVTVARGAVCAPSTADHDAAFVAHARTDLPALVAWARRVVPVLKYAAKRICRESDDIGECPMCAARALLKEIGK